MEFNKFCEKESINAFRFDAAGQFATKVVQGVVFSYVDQ